MSSPSDDPGTTTEPLATAKVGSAAFNGWTIDCNQSHILKSKCYKSKEGCEKDDPSPCSVCLFNKRLELPHLPDMVFPENVLRLTHNKTNLVIEFNAFDALKLVSTDHHTVKIACADDWIASRADDPNIHKVAHPFDWTFTTHYSGTLKNGFHAEPTDKRIDMVKLAQMETILYHREVPLYEDELHDNGMCTLALRIVSYLMTPENQHKGLKIDCENDYLSQRVMPSGFFALLRLFVRVDEVMVRVIDTRYHHEFENNYVLRERTVREATQAELKAPISGIIDSHESVQRLPAKTVKTEILWLSKDATVSTINS